MRTRLPLLLTLALSLIPSFAGSGCSATTTQTKVARPNVRGADTGPAFESPARWVAFPLTVGAPQATLILDDGRCLVTTDDGQRWLVTPRDKTSPCSGIGLASGSPTFEPLVGAQRVGDEFRFVAEGGVVYTSREPNGPFTRYAKAPTNLRRVAARGSAIVGIDELGGTHFYDGDKWKEASVPKDHHAIDAGVDEQGRVLWLGAPETLLASTDAGRTYAPLAGGAPAPIGAYDVGFMPGGKLAARGVLGNLLWDGDRLVPSKAKFSEVHTTDVDIEPSTGPRASMLLEQRAALDGTRYSEVFDSYEGSRYGLARSSLGGVAEKIPLQELEGCDNVRLAAAGGVLVFGCMKQVEGKPNLVAELWLSKDRGQTMELVTSLATPSFSDVSISISHDGTMLVVGACKEQQAKPDAGEADAGAEPVPEICSPKGPVLIRGATVTTGSVPYLEEGSARSPLLSPDGRTAYFLGRNRKDSMPAVFVSREGGQSYQMRTIEPPQESSWEETENTEGDGGYVRPLYLTESAMLTMDETGTLGVAAERDMGFSWITLDADGRIANVGEPPEPSFMLGGVGGRVLALAYGQVDGVLRSWESLDGGVTWAEIATTPAVQRYGERGGPLTCAQGGCLFGDELARVGWEGQAEPPFTMTEDLFPQDFDAALSVPISCQLASKSEWIKLEGRPEERATATTWGAYTSGPTLPRLRELMRGKTAFSVATIADDGKVEITSGAAADKDGAPSPISKKGFLGPMKSGGWVATTMRAQSEGYVALRAKVPALKSGGLDTTKKIEGVELAWQNQFNGVVSKKTIAFEALWTPAFVSGSILKPTLLTVTNQGVVIQPTPGARALYVDAQATTAFDYPNLGAVVSDGRPIGISDATYLGGNPFAFAFVDRSPTAQLVLSVRAASASGAKGSKAPGGASAEGSPQATTIAPAGAEVDWIYAGDQAGVLTLVSSSRKESPPRALGFMMDADGKLTAPLELPTLADLASRPQPCSVEQRKSSPRVVSPHFGRHGALLFAQGRHAVMVTDAVSSGASPLGAVPLEPIWLLTDGGVLHGTKKDPCLAAWRASGTRPGFAAVIGGNLEHSYLLRTTSTTKAAAKGVPAYGGRWMQTVEARPMVCRYQTDLSVPYEVAGRANQRMTDDQP